MTWVVYDTYTGEHKGVIKWAHLVSITWLDVKYCTLNYLKKSSQK